MKCTTVEDENGKRWYKDGKLHREDGPAIENTNGSTFWYKNGLRHRKGGPAIELPNGRKYWYIDGELHREDGPAFEYGNGAKSWYLRGINFSEEDYWKINGCKYCGSKIKSMETINGIIYYCPKCQR